ncbi:MAG: N-acetylmuramoyl-L-alanine amidase [Deltaproteobacteria bacterium]|nr:N-acetylmuramoyl-L-alanine amidase [Deltaproteobacteria bacterium]
MRACLACLWLLIPFSLAWGQGQQTEFATEIEATGQRPGETVPPVRARLHEHRGASAGVRRIRRNAVFWGPANQPIGALSGKVIYLSPGHGWTYLPDQGAWRTQRGNNLGIVEDMGNADGVTQFLVPLLQAAGAQVVGIRELDPTPEWAIVDNDGGGNGSYRETGDSSAFSNSTLDGFRVPNGTITGSTNPFSQGTNRLMLASTNETARATFVLDVPKSGYYNLYIAYSMYSARVSDAEHIVVHPGGRTTFLVDQRRHGSTWVLLGRFYFRAGQNESIGALIVTNRSADASVNPEANVSIDAVRIGGGSGIIDRGGGVSGQPRYDQCARYHAQFAGAPASVYDRSGSSDRDDDVSARSRFTDWHHGDGEDAVYVSYHSNAVGGRGTETYVYGTNPPNGSYAPTSAAIALRSPELAKAVHDAVVDVIRAEVDPSWKDRGVRSAYFGEINPAYQDEIPATLLEVAFHDQTDDAAQLREPAFRRAVARGIYRGIVEYFAERDNIPRRLVPDAPVAIVARHLGQRSVRIAWSPPAAVTNVFDSATSYRIYTSTDGLAFDDGIDVGSSPSYTATLPGSAAAFFFRITAVNGGGESLPSKVIAIGVAGTPRGILLVDGFDRQDATMSVLRSYPSLGQVGRLLLEKMNHAGQLDRHGRALATAGAGSFDSATHQAISEGLIRPTDYQYLLWHSGLGVDAQRALTSTSRALLLEAANAGIGLVLSGATLARTLAAGDSSDRALLDALHTAAQGTTAASSVSGGSGPFSDLPTLALSSADMLPYAVSDVDRLSSLGGEIAANYTSGGTAATAAAQGAGCRLLFGFPLEAITSANGHAQLLQRLLQFCQLPTTPITDGGMGGDYAMFIPPGDGCCSVTPKTNGGPFAATLLALWLLCTRRGRKPRDRR